MTTNLRILHCFRAPVGGLYRHVRDLVTAQTEMGHHIAVVCDSRTGGKDAEKSLRELDELCSFGVWRIPMSRNLGPSDYFAIRSVQKFAAKRFGTSIIHGHGAKGGAYARLAASRLKREGLDAKSIYTPHGGSLHYDERSLLGRVYLDLERRLAPSTDAIIFESAFSARAYQEKVGLPSAKAVVIPNGVYPREFAELHLDSLAADFLFVGELRQLKGPDVFLDALAILSRKRDLRAVIVGSGKDEASLKRQASKLGIDKSVQFLGRLNAHQAFVRGRCLVVPSRAESFPYIVLEGAAAHMPMILTDVGGIPEITEGTQMTLIPPGEASVLAQHMESFLVTPSVFIERAHELAGVVSERYTVNKMAQAVSDLYQSLFTLPPDPI